MSFFGWGYSPRPGPKNPKPPKGGGVCQPPARVLDVDQLPSELSFKVLREDEMEVLELKRELRAHKDAAAELLTALEGAWEYTGWSSLPDRPRSPLERKAHNDAVKALEKAAKLLRKNKAS